MLFDFHFFSCVMAGMLGVLIALGHRGNADTEDEKVVAK